MRDWAENLKKNNEEFIEFIISSGYGKKMAEDAKKALMPPDMPERTIEIWNFIYKEMHRASRYIPSMDKPIFQYLDKTYLRQEMKDSMGLDFNKYSFVLSYFEKAIIDNQK